MRRACALIVLVVFVGVPALQLHCAVSCAPRNRAVASVDCPLHHHQANGALALRAAHCCVNAVASGEVATTVPHRASERPALLAQRVAPTRGIAIDPTRTSCAAPLHGPPPGSFGAPLRV